LSTLVLRHPKLGVKDFCRFPPEIDQARPACCPGCGAAARPLGAPFVVVGHGCRRRTLIFKTGLGNQIRIVVIFVRRFRCRRCGVTITLVPSTVRPRRRYDLALIVFMLATWTFEGLPAAALRQLVCTEPHLDWPQLRRWTRALDAGRGPPKERASRVAQRFAAHAPPGTRQGLALAQRAFIGAAYLR
jgi:hypothetical protein